MLNQPQTTHANEMTALPVTQAVSIVPSFSFLRSSLASTRPAPAMREIVHIDGDF